MSYSIRYVWFLRIISIAWLQKYLLLVFQLKKQQQQRRLFWPNRRNYYYWVIEVYS